MRLGTQLNAKGLFSLELGGDENEETFIIGIFHSGHRPVFLYVWRMKNHKGMQWSETLMLFNE